MICKKNITRVIRICITSMIMMIIHMNTVHGSSDMTLHLESAQTDYIIREPVKFIVTLQNNNSEIQNYVGMTELDENMKYLYYKIHTPFGETELRKSQYLHFHGHTGDNWPGYPFRPGQRVVLFLYPNVTQCLGVRDCEFVTFSMPGTYKIQVVYYIPERFARLWKGQDGKLYSNEVLVTFRQPSHEEKEILDAIWYKRPSLLSSGDDGLLVNFSKSKLENVIENHNDNELIKYAYFSLARQLISDGRGSWERAIELLELVLRKYPNFRYEEVRKHLAITHFNIDRGSNQAISILNETLKKRPWLKDNINFMSLKIFIESHGRTGAVDEWLDKRRAGQ